MGKTDSRGRAVESVFVGDGRRQFAQPDYAKFTAEGAPGRRASRRRGALQGSLISGGCGARRRAGFGDGDRDRSPPDGGGARPRFSEKKDDGARMSGGGSESQTNSGRLFRGSPGTGEWWVRGASLGGIAL